MYFIRVLGCLALCSLLWPHFAQDGPDDGAELEEALVQVQGFFDNM